MSSWYPYFNVTAEQLLGGSFLPKGLYTEGGWILKESIVFAVLFITSKRSLSPQLEADCGEREVGKTVLPIGELAGSL